MMATPLSVLLVEDSEDDALFVLRELKHAGYEVTFDRVDTPEAMRNALKKRKWDIVLSDYAMPRFSAAEALAIFKEVGQDIPFIIVSGAIGEQTAVDLMKAGADDFVMKDELARLVPAVQRELADAEARRERKLAQEKLKESEERYRLLFESSPDVIAQVDLDGRFITANMAMIKSLGFSAEEDVIGKTFHDLMPKDVANHRLKMVRKACNDWSTQIFEDKRGGRWFHNIFVPIRISEKGEITVQIIARDITENRKAQEQLERSFVDLAETVSRAMFSRDPYTATHQRNVAELARFVGRRLGLDKNTLQGLYIGGLLHDIGKISIPEGLLNKPGKLTEEEWNLIRTHARRGYDILKDAHLPWPVAEMALHHHERLDGSGYPDGISGEELSIEVRILGVCDVVEAMSTYRPYRPARTTREVIKELQNGRGTKYDPTVVDTVLNIIEKGEFDFHKSL
jgi:PAS domain S-box-containing protein